MIIRYIVERYVGEGNSAQWEQVAELPFNVATLDHANNLMTGAQLRYPGHLHRVSPFWMTDEEFIEQEHTLKLERIADDILRQVVCHCGCYRHHGVSWMLEGSGEGLSVAVEILRKAGL